MSIFSRNKEQRDAALGNLEDLIAQRAGIPGYSGESVNEVTALGVSTVLSCVSILSDSIAALPIKVYRELDDRNITMATPRFLKTPNLNQSRFDFIHQLVTSLALHGNAYVLVDRDTAERPIALAIIHPDKVKVEIENGQKMFAFNDRMYTKNNVLHFTWFTYPGSYKGVSPLKTQKNTIGVALAMERHIGQFYGQGATPSSILETDQAMTKEQAEVLQATWTGSHNKNRKPAVLTGGLKWKAISDAAGDELVKARDQIVKEIARVYRIPSFLIHSDGSSGLYSNVESSGIQFVRHTLLPWLSRIEEGFSSLLPGASYARFDVSEYQRGDRANTIRAAQTAISSGIFTPNEIRQQLDYEPYEGGDNFYIGLQGAPIGPDIPPVGTDAVTPSIQDEDQQEG
tara:strand:- start:4311 stop:5510 length:1200 start_codon:yes stop_codon:yes gene_type:complete